jgi:hypothetical protein
MDSVFAAAAPSVQGSSAPPRDDAVTQRRDGARELAPLLKAGAGEHDAALCARLGGQGFE